MVEASGWHSRFLMDGRHKMKQDLRVSGSLHACLIEYMRLGVFLTVLMLGCGKTDQFENISLVSESRDKKYRVWLYEHPNRMDRNFDVWVEQIADGSRTNIFKSPDEGRPVGTERIIWSENNDEFVLVGKEFFLANPSEIGLERPYLWYSFKTQKLYCNASQTELPHFSEDDLTWSGYENDVYRNAKVKR